MGRYDPYLALEDVSVAQYRRIIGVNLDGVFNGIKVLLPRMRENGGAITVTASIAGFGPLAIRVGTGAFGPIGQGVVHRGVKAIAFADGVAFLGDLPDTVMVDFARLQVGQIAE